MKHVNPFILNERKLGTGISIFQYVYANEFADWVKSEFGAKDPYHRTLENDYIEGSLGSRWRVGDSQYCNDKEVGEWIEKFLETFELEEIQFKYGG